MKLSHLTHLCLVLNFSDTVSDLCSISTLTNLRSLTSQVCNLTDNAFRNLSNLNVLDIARSKFSANFLEITDFTLSRLPKLETLRLKSFTYISDSGLALLTNLRSLTLMPTCCITNHGLSHLTGLTDLTILDCNCNDLKYRFFFDVDPPYPPILNDDGFKYLTNLLSLSVEGNLYISEKLLATMTNLTNLNLKRDKREISDHAISCLTNLNQLIA